MIIVAEYTLINSYIKYVFDYIKEIKSIELIKYFNSLKYYCIKNNVNIDKEYNDYLSVRKYLHNSFIILKDTLISIFSLIITKLKKNDCIICNTYEEYETFSFNMNKSLFIYKIMYFINDYKNNDLKEDLIYSEID